MKKTKTKTKNALPGEFSDELQDLIDSAMECADLAERHMEHTSKQTVLIQEAAALARHGQIAEARRLKGQADLASAQVFNYDDVLARLITAVKAYREGK